MPGDIATVGILFILGFISLGVAVISVLRFWLVEGTLDFGPALGVLGALLLGSAWALKTASPVLMFSWIVAMLGGSWLVPSLIENSDKSALHKMYESDIARQKRAIENGVNIADAWREIGELYLRMNRYDEAIAAFKEAIRAHPRDIEKVRRRLNLALEYREGMPNAKTIICEDCGQETPVGKNCIHCGAALETSFAGWLMQSGSVSEIWKPTAALAIVAIALVSIFSPMPLASKAFIALMGLCAGAVLIWLMVKDES